MTSGLLFSRSQKKGSSIFSPCQIEMCSTCLAMGGSVGVWAMSGGQRVRKTTTLIERHVGIGISRFDDGPARAAGYSSSYSAGLARGESPGSAMRRILMIPKFVPQTRSLYPSGPGYRARP